MIHTAGAKGANPDEVLLELDTEPRTVEPPADLASALARDKKAAAAVAKLLA